MAKTKSKMMKPIQVENAKKIIALYRRVSTDRQREEGYSLDVQEDRLRAYAKTIDGVSDVLLYTDDGFSGGSLERPAIQKLISDVEDGKITHVIVVKLDRLSRSQKDTLHMIEDVFIPHNVAFISIQESFNTNTPFGRAMIGILSVFAQLERENIYERTRSGMQKRVEEGYWPGGGRPPFGYDYDPQQNILVPNEDADKVRYIYDRYLAGDGLQKIADDVGLVYERIAYDILTRKTNAGFIVYNGVEYKGRHEPIISEETYRAAMSLYRKRSAKKLFSKTDHLLAGMITCGVCGARMRYQKWRSDRWKLVCYSRQKSKAYLVKDPNCDNEYVWADEIEVGVIDAVFRVAREWDASSPGPEAQVVAMTEEEVLFGQLGDEKRKLKRLYGIYASKGDELLLETIDELKQSISELEEKLEHARDIAAIEESKRATIKKIRDVEGAWSFMDTKERRAILCEVIDDIILTHGQINVRLKV